ncbi:MAG: hypothetical protein RXN84_06040 [Caldivirga sp.]
MRLVTWTIGVTQGAYVYARVLDGLVEAKLALEMLSRGLCRMQPPRHS